MDCLFFQKTFSKITPLKFSFLDNFERIQTYPSLLRIG